MLVDLRSKIQFGIVYLIQTSFSTNSVYNMLYRDVVMCCKFKTQVFGVA